MPKKYIVRLLRPYVVSSYLMFATGCSIELDEIAAPEPVNLTESSDQCFEKAGTTFQAFFQGASTKQSVQEAFSCLRTAVDLFEKFARSESGDRTFYTSGELRTFFRDTFAPSIASSEPLWNELMRVKQLVVGGSTDKVQRSELQSARDLLVVLEEEALKLQPWMSFLSAQMSVDDFRKLSPNAQVLYFNSATQSLSAAVERIARIVAQNGQGYPVSALTAILEEFRKVEPTDSDWTKSISDQIGLFQAAKAVLLDGDGSEIRASEWTTLGTVAGQALSIWLRFEYLLSDRDLFYGEGLTQFESVTQEIRALIGDAIQRKPNRVLALPLLQTLVIEATGPVLGPEKARRFELPLTASTINQLLPVVLGRLAAQIQTGVGGRPLDPNDPESVIGIRPSPNGFTQPHLDFVFTRFLNWVAVQRKFEGIEERFKLVNGGAEDIPLTVVRSEWSQRLDQSNPVDRDLFVIFNAPLPPSTEDDGTMMFRRADAITYDRKSFREMNWKQVAVRVIGDGYVSNPEAHRYKGILLSQFETVFSDFKNLAVDLEFIEPEEQSIYQTGFFVSSVFLYSSDGDDRLSFQEAVDLFVVSFGTDPVRSPVNEAVAVNCPPVLPTPFGSKPWYGSDCWRFHYRSVAPSSFRAVPGWGRELPRYDEGQWNLLLASLAQASRQPNSIEGTVQPAEMTRPFSVQMYIESLFTRWDLNQDLILSFAEAERAYPLFYPLLKEVSGLPDDEVFAVYAWILANGRPPTTLTEKVRFATRWRRAGRDVWAQTANADRLRIAQIFGALASEISN